MLGVKWIQVMLAVSSVVKSKLYNAVLYSLTACDHFSDHFGNLNFSLVSFCT